MPGPPWTTRTWSIDAANHEVLLGLDRCDDLAHRAGPLGADLGEHRVRDASGADRPVGIIEMFVEVGGQLTVVEHEPPAQIDPERVGAGRPVEGRGDRRPPVDDDRVVVLVLDVASPDVPPLGPVLLGVDAAEEVTGTRRREVLERLLDGDLDVLGRELVRRGERVDAT